MRALWALLLLPGAALACEDLAPVLAGAEPVCSTSRTLGEGASRDCFWTYAYRSEAAQEAFDALRARLEACTDAGLVAEAGDVNHPDSFDQLTGRVQGRAVSLSLKDKAGRAETLVVLRVAEP